MFHPKIGRRHSRLSSSFSAFLSRGPCRSPAHPIEVAAAAVRDLPCRICVRERLEVRRARKIRAQSIIGVTASAPRPNRGIAGNDAFIDVEDVVAGFERLHAVSEAVVGSGIQIGICSPAVRAARHALAVHIIADEWWGPGPSPCCALAAVRPPSTAQLYIRRARADSAARLGLHAQDRVPWPNVAAVLPFRVGERGRGGAFFGSPAGPPM